VTAVYDLPYPDPAAVAAQLADGTGVDWEVTAGPSCPRGRFAGSEHGLAVVAARYAVHGITPGGLDGDLTV